MYLFAVVYGPEWEDIKYYSDFEEAKNSLILYTKKLDDDFCPLLRCLTLKDRQYVDANPPYSFDSEKNELYQMDMNSCLSFK